MTPPRSPAPRFPAHRSLWPVLLASAGLSACAAPDGRTRVVLTAPDALGLASASAAATLPDRWWEALGDPQLDRVVDDALANNPTLDTALARVARAEAEVGARRAVAAPQATLDAQAQALRLSGRYTIPPPFAGSTTTIGQAAGNLRWSLDLFGRYRSAVRQAGREADAARLDARAARLAIASSVVQSYAEMARAERQVAVAARALATREGARRLTRVQVRQGLAARLDLAAGDVLVADARRASVAAAAAREAAVHALAALAGRGGDYYASLGPARLVPAAALRLPAALPADLLLRRPDLAAARARVEAADQGRTAARRAWMPDIDLIGLAGFQAVGLARLFTPDALTGGPGIGLSLPILDGGRRRAGLAAAVAVRDAAAADYNARAVAAVREAADALTRLRAAETERARADDARRALAEVGRLNGVRVASGLSSRLDLVDNDVRLLAAEQALADLDADALVQRVRLVEALGGGFRPDSTPDDTPVTDDAR